MCQMCSKCSKMTAGILVVLGILFLLRDINVWNFWNISWWTALILLAGVTMFCSGGCPDCCAIEEKPKKKK